MDPSEIKILLAVPTFGDPNFETIISLKRLATESPYNLATKYKKSTYIHTARNKFVFDAVDLGADYLMFIDADMSFEPEAFNTLVKHSLEINADIMGGLYVSRYDCSKNIIKEIVTNDQGEKVLHDIEKIPTFEKPFEVDGIGTGFLLIKMDVFKKIDPPYFYYPNPKEFGLKEVPFPNNELGDDISFCIKARTAGIKIYCDPTFELGHIGKKIYRHPHYEVKEVFEGNIE